jgi:hypothetical protein
MQRPVPILVLMLIIVLVQNQRISSNVVGKGKAASPSFPLSKRLLTNLASVISIPVSNQDTGCNANCNPAPHQHQSHEVIECTETKELSLILFNPTKQVVPTYPSTHGRKFSEMHSRTRINPSLPLMDHHLYSTVPNMEYICGFHESIISHANE